MSRTMHALAFVHYSWGAILFAVAAWWIIAGLAVLPHMSSRTFAGQLVATLSLALVYGAPPALLGWWMFVLGSRIRRSAAGLRQNLLITHALLLLPGIGLTLLGCYAVRAAARSTSEGGGLLSPVAILPLAAGATIIVVSVLSIATALSTLPGRSAG